MATILEVIIFFIWSIAKALLTFMFLTKAGWILIAIAVIYLLLVK